MNEYTLTSVKVMGEEHPTYGWTYWCSAEETDMPLRFSSKRVMSDGVKIYAERQTEREGSKGPYLQLAMVKMASDVKEDQPPSQSPSKPVKSSEKFLKDVSDYPLRVYLGGLPYVDSQHLIKDSEYRREYLEYVKEVADELLKYTESIRGD